MRYVSSGGAPVGRVIELCDNPASDLPALLASDAQTVATQQFDSEITSRCVSTCSRATHAIVEYDYFDLDARSNAAITIGFKHQTRMPTTDRVVFIRRRDEHPELSVEPSVDDVLTLIRGSEAVGYMVLSGERHGPIGRSILPVPASIDGVRVGVDINRRVRTTVSEPISVFGAPLEVRGVPFMQQDRNVFTCAHVAAWAVHYAAVLRGLVSRRATANFHLAAAEAGDMVRSFPSLGLTAPQVATVLERFGLPVVTINVHDLDKNGRAAQWYDRQAIWDLSTRLSDAVAADDGTFETRVLTADQRLRDLEEELSEAEADGVATPAELARLRRQLFELDDLIATVEEFWMSESVTATICQFLNSGFPAIVLENFHARVIVGYLRREDIEHPESFAGSSDTDVVAFLVTDDGAGPYEVVPVDDIVAGLAAASDAHVLIPLPPEIWVSPTEVEDLGATVFAGALRACVSALANQNASQLEVHASATEAAAVLSELQALEHEIATQAPGDLSLRSYLLPSQHFKASFEHCCPDTVAVNQTALANLPKFVWVVEVIRRSVRQQDLPCVLGTVVLDATDIDLMATNATLVHLPGAIRVKGAFGAGRWHITPVKTTYDSGRYRNTTRRPDEEPIVRATNWKRALAARG